MCVMLLILFSKYNYKPYEYKKKPGMHSIWIHGQIFKKKVKHDMKNIEEYSLVNDSQNMELPK